jgi:hypothetical protein
VVVVLLMATDNVREHERRIVTELLRSIWLLSDEGRAHFCREFAHAFCRYCGKQRTKEDPICHCENDE